MICVIPMGLRGLVYHRFSDSLGTNRNLLPQEQGNFRRYRGGCQETTAWTLRIRPLEIGAITASGENTSDEIEYTYGH
jgi:hypothetical protein